MKPSIGASRRALETVRADATVVFVVEKGEPLGLAGEHAGEVLREIKRVGFKGERAETLRVGLGSGRSRRHVVVAGLGPARGIDVERVLHASGAAARELRKLKAGSIAVGVPELAGLEPADVEQAVAQGLLLGFYHFDEYVSARKADAHVPDKVTLCVARTLGAAKAALASAKALAEGIAQARDLVNLAPMDLEPESFEKRAAATAKRCGLSLKVLREPALRREKMGALLAVGQGSDVRPRLLHLVHKPRGRARARIAWVGKGITFDAGGYNLKTVGNIETMKCDMGGAAAVMGALVAASRMDLPVEIHGVIPLAENLVSGGAYKPGDVLRTRAGKTVEINNTDAEGRLILADALDWAREKIKPEAMIDLATLTGACVVALGPQAAGLMSDHEDLAEVLLAAAARAGEKVWRLPLYPEYKKQLESPIADMLNTGLRWGGALTAGLFLQHFVGRTRWAHLDIAGPAFFESDHAYHGRGGTGAGVATLVEFAKSL